MAYEQHIVPAVQAAATSDYSLALAALWFIIVFAVFALIFDAFEHDANHWDD